MMLTPRKRGWPRGKAGPEKKRQAQRDSYGRQAKRDSYEADPEKKREAERKSNPAPKIAADIVRYKKKTGT
jgi:hypothetical protein